MTKARSGGKTINRHQENLRQKGSFYEQQAAFYLESQGYRILDRNYYTKTGELDLVCEETVIYYGRAITYLVFVEVKYRSSNRLGLAVEAVDHRKRSRITKSAQIYMKRHGISFQRPVRFDILAIDGSKVSLIRNAFGGM